MKETERTGAQPTIDDVAVAAGVSRATAARVLGGYGYVGAATGKKVLAAAKKLSYQPNQLARSMATGRSKTIGLVIADIENLYFARAIRAITDAAGAKGFAVILTTTDEDIEREREAVQVLLSKRVDGLIVSPTSSIDIDHLARARDAGVPIVLLDRRVPKLNADTFAVDNYGAAHQAVASLVSKGHRRVALVSNAPSHGEKEYLISSVRERIDGYRAALHDAAIEIDPNLVVLGGWDRAKLTDKIKTLCASPDRPTAMLTTDSSVALVILNVLREQNLSIPGDMSVISFDDADWMAAVTPPLTVISQPIKELSTAATENLVARLLGESTSNSKEVLLPATVIERESVRSV